MRLGFQKCTNSTEEAAVVPLLVFDTPSPPLFGLLYCVAAPSLQADVGLSDKFRGACFPPQDVIFETHTGWKGRLWAADKGRQ